MNDVIGTAPFMIGSTSLAEYAPKKETISSSVLEGKPIGKYSK